MSDDKTWRGPERRTNLRVREMVDDLQSAVRDNRAAIAALTIRMTNVEADVRELKEATPPS
jgi:hypothetical protein